MRPHTDAFGFDVDVGELGGALLMIRLAFATQASQMYTRGPATSFETCVESLPQNEHFSVLSLNMTRTSVDVTEQ
jgi:hypothetical protein